MSDRHKELHEENERLRAENARLRRALERIAGTTMSMVLDYNHGFARCRQLAAEALNEHPAQ